jgi:hypothetical protein
MNEAAEVIDLENDDFENAYVVMDADTGEVLRVVTTSFDEDSEEKAPAVVADIMDAVNGHGLSTVVCFCRVYNPESVIGVTVSASYAHKSKDHLRAKWEKKAGNAATQYFLRGVST